MSQWIRAKTRWALYLRDGLRCTYCRVTMAEILQDYGDTFLTLDHITARCRGGSHELDNLVTACSSCNVIKGRGTVAGLARRLNVPGSTLRGRIQRSRSRELERYLGMAEVLIGAFPGVPAARMVVDHDYLVRRQWSGETLDMEVWGMERLEREPQLDLPCPQCGRSHALHAEEARAVWRDRNRDTQMSDVPF